MSKPLMRYRVVREHIGYAEGSTREAYEQDVAHLVPHVLELIGPAETSDAAAKAETAPLNKAETGAPGNKAVRSRKSKAK